jgi:anaphase-promoting complex subunit 2
MQSRKRIFSSVFPDAFSYTIPTPVATPVASFIAPGQSFGAQTELATSTQSPTSSFVAEHIRWNRAWHTATSFLSLPGEPITFQTLNLGPTILQATWSKQPLPDAHEAIKYLLFTSKQSSSDDSPNGDDLVGWYINEVRMHFLAFVRPGIHLVRMLSLPPVGILAEQL